MNQIKKIVNNEIQIENLKKQVLETKSLRIENEKVIKQALKDSFEQLESDLDLWKHKYLLTAEMNGKVSYYDLWSDNQYVNDWRCCSGNSS